MSVEVYLAGRGLVCSLGPDVAAAVAALREGDVAPGRIEVAAGFAWPFHAIAEPDGGWATRARRIVCRAAEESGALASSRSGPLFLASSSVDIGERELSGDFEHDFHAFAEELASWLDWRGPVFTVSTACTSALNAVLSARTLIRTGQAENALVLGLELSNRLTVAGFGAMQLLAPDRAQPLGAARKGLVLGEAVAALHLSNTAARWRIAGGANVVDGCDAAGAVPGAITAMCHQALADSGLAPADIALVKLQSAGSPGNDATEVAALRQVFEPLPGLMSLKAAIGHTLGASGAAELALLTACIEAGAWPRADHPIDESLQARLAGCAPCDARYILASILGFGGGHAAVVLEDCTRTSRPGS